MSAGDLDAAAQAAMLDGSIVLAGLLALLVVMQGCTSSAVANAWKPCREQPDAVMIITPDGNVLNCITHPDATAPRPKPKRPAGGVQ